MKLKLTSLGVKICRTSKVSTTEPNQWGHGKLARRPSRWGKESTWPNKMRALYRPDLPMGRGKIWGIDKYITILIQVMKSNIRVFEIEHPLNRRPYGWGHMGGAIWVGHGIFPMGNRQYKSGYIRRTENTRFD